MNIDKRNFNENYDIIVQAISEADFLAFDTEFTGIHCHPDQKRTKYDSFEDSYQKMKQTTINFNIIQFGISAFKWNPDNKKYAIKCFNIYLHKKKSKEFENLYLVSGDSLTFLAFNDMDFINLYRNGLNYNRLTQSTLNIEKEPRRERDKTFFSVNTEKKIFEIFNSLEKFLFEDIQQKEIIIDCQNEFLQNYFNNRLLINHFGVENINLQKKFLPDGKLQFKKPKGFSAQRTNPVEKMNSIKPGEQSEAMEIEETKSNNITNQETNKACELINNTESIEDKKAEIPFMIKKERDFTDLFQEIIQARKVLIGHNLILDLGLIFDNFIAELPDTFSAFTKEINKYFPLIMDTKVIAFDIQTFSKLYMETHLDALYQQCFMKSLKGFNNTYLDPNPLNSRYNTGQIQHEAGYDSYITGVAFVSTINFKALHMKKKENQKIKESELIQLILESPIDLNIAKKYFNMTPSYLDSDIDFTYDITKNDEYYRLNPDQDQKLRTLFLIAPSNLYTQHIGDIVKAIDDAMVFMVKPGQFFVEYFNLNFERTSLLEIKDKLQALTPKDWQWYCYHERPVFKPIRYVPYQAINNFNNANPTEYFQYQ